MNKENNIFELHVDMFGKSEDRYSSLAKSMKLMSHFGAAEMDFRITPFQNFKKDWIKIYGDFTNATWSFSWQYDATKQYSQAMMQGINSYVKIYEAWLSSMDETGKKLFELIQGITNGRKINVDEISCIVFDAANESHNKVSDSLIASLKSTPFKEALKGIEEIEKGIQQFANTFPREQKQAKKIFQTFCDSYIRIITYSTVSLMNDSRNFSDMLVTGNVYVDAFKKRLNTYSETSKEAIGELLGPLSALIPDNKYVVADLTDWASKHFDLLASWFEVSLSLAQGIGKSLSEMYWFSYDTFTGGKMSSPEEFGNCWPEFYEKATVNFAGNSRLFVTLPKFINTLTEFIESTNHLYQGLSTPFLPNREKIAKAI